MGTTAVDRKNQIGRRERREILKNVQGRGERVVAVDKGQEERSKKASLVAITKVKFGRPSSTSFGLGAGSLGGCKPDYRSAAKLQLRDRSARQWTPLEE